jgi:hypothetical protein
MPKKEPTQRTESPLSEERVVWRGVILQGGYSYLNNGETVKYPTKGKGYLVDWDPNPSRLLSDDNGYFTISVGNHTAHMLNAYTDTPEERRRRPWLRNQLGMPIHPPPD